LVVHWVPSYEGINHWLWPSVFVVYYHNELSSVRSCVNTPFLAIDFPSFLQEPKMLCNHSWDDKEELQLSYSPLAHIPSKDHKYYRQPVPFSASAWTINFWKKLGIKDEYEEDPSQSDPYSMHSVYFLQDSRKFSNLQHDFPSSTISSMDNFSHKDIHFILIFLSQPHREM